MSNPFPQKLTGLAARKAQAEAALVAAGKPLEIDPSKMEHRIGIVFDDSGSMSGQAIKDAHEGCEEFLRSCAKDTTAVAIYPMNEEPLKLCSNLPAVALMVKKIDATGGTPLIQTLNRMLDDNSLTRAIVFSDGSPQGYSEADYKKAVSREIAVDTVYIAGSYVEERAASFMKKLAEGTGGIYLQFERGKSNFRTAFKYLSPGLRYLLTDKAFVAKLEGK